MADLHDLLAERHIIVCTGSGGVGKTTVAATLALAAASQGRRTIVVTIDPAKRLAQSLGLKVLDNTPRAVAGTPNLDAMMLDMQQTFDDVIDRHAQDPARAARIKANRFYQQLSSSLAGTQEYMAMEKLFDLHHNGEYDCIVVDTPPTRNALDFLDAPKRLTDFLEGRFLRMFLSPGLTATRTIGKAAAFGTGLFMKAAGRITGVSVLDDLAEFFRSFDGMYEGFKQRAQSVYALLSSGEAAFVVVTTPEPAALREARYFSRRLDQDRMPLAAVIINRVSLPISPHLATVLDGLDERDAASAFDDDDHSRAVEGLVDLARRQADVHHRQIAAVEAGLHGVDMAPRIGVPLMPTDVHDLEGLRAVGRHLVGT